MDVGPNQASTSPRSACRCRRSRSSWPATNAAASRCRSCPATTSGTGSQPVVCGRPADTDRPEPPGPPGRVHPVPPRLDSALPGADRGDPAHRRGGEAVRPGAVPVERPDGHGEVAWTMPLDRARQAVALVRSSASAAIITIAAVSGMRSSELMELQVGRCRPPEHHRPAGARYR